VLVISLVVVAAVLTVAGGRGVGGGGAGLPRVPRPVLLVLAGVVSPVARRVARRRRVSRRRRRCRRRRRRPVDCL